MVLFTKHTIRLFSSTSILLPRTTFALISSRVWICFADTYERETLWVAWARLYEELISPAVQSVETLRVIHIIYEHTAVGASVKSDT